MSDSEALLVEHNDWRTRALNAEAELAEASQEGADLARTRAELVRIVAWH
jgi:hypothetical protein